MRFYENRKEKQQWFAWRPVRVKGYIWVWLERVNRQWISNSSIYGYWEYSFIIKKRKITADDEFTRNLKKAFSGFAKLVKGTK